MQRLYTLETPTDLHQMSGVDVRVVETAVTNF